MEAPIDERRTPHEDDRGFRLHPEFIQQHSDGSREGPFRELSERFLSLIFPLG